MSVASAAAFSPQHFASRMRLFFAGYFLFGGVSIPFFPVWLEARGLTPVEIAAAVALPAFLRVFLTPLAGYYADRAPNRRLATITFVVPATLIFLFAWAAEGFWALLIITAASFTLWSFANPVADALALTGVRRFGLDYGRLRLSGSVSWIVANLASGALLGVLAAESIYWFMLAALIASTIVAFALPVTPPAVRALDDTERPKRPSMTVLLARPAFLTLLLVGGLIQASHAVLYSFGSIQWSALGFSGFDIGVLWAIGVICEILLFGTSGWWVRIFGPAGLLALGAVAAILRWLVYAGDPGFLVFAALQSLHGLTFGAVYLGTQHAIARAAPEELTASAQGLFVMISGLLTAVTTTLAGPLYASLGAHAYLVMAVLPVVSLVILALHRRFAAPGEAQPQSAGSGG